MWFVDVCCGLPCFFCRSPPSFASICMSVRSLGDDENTLVGVTGRTQLACLETSEL